MLFQHGFSIYQSTPRDIPPQVSAGTVLALHRTIKAERYVIPNLKEVTNSKHGAWRISGADIYIKSRGPVQTDPPFKLVVQVSGQAEVRQGGRKACLTPQAMTLIDTATPFEVAINGPFQQVVAAFPRTLITSLSRGIEYRTALTHAGPGSPGLIADFAHAYAESSARMSEAERSSASIAIAHLVDGLCHSHIRERVGTLFRQAAQLIDSNIAAADAETIAEQLGISRRYLDRIFSSRGRTFSEHLWERRLVLAANRLQGKLGASVTEIAHSVGFKDGSHFARAFRKRFDAAPREWRAKGKHTQ